MDHPKIYDPKLDGFRLATQEDVDLLARAVQAYGVLRHYGEAWRDFAHDVAVGSAGTRAECRSIPQCMYVPIMRSAAHYGPDKPFYMIELDATFVFGRDGVLRLSDKGRPVAVRFEGEASERATS